MSRLLRSGKPFVNTTLTQKPVLTIKIIISKSGHLVGRNFKVTPTRNNAMRTRFFVVDFVHLEST